MLGLYRSSIVIVAFVAATVRLLQIGRVYQIENGVGIASGVNIEGGVTWEFIRVMTDVWFEMTRLVDEARVASP